MNVQSACTLNTRYLRKDNTCVTTDNDSNTHGYKTFDRKFERIGTQAIYKICSLGCLTSLAISQKRRCWFLAWLIFQHWKWNRYIPLKCRWTSIALHGITSQEIVLFIGCGCHILVSCLARPLTLRMQAVCSYEMSEQLYWTTWCYISEDSILHGLYLLPASWWFLVLTYSLTLKIEAVHLSEISLDVYQTTWPCMAEDSTLISLCLLPTGC
jgi:hypothetical protein